tara:strand:- start:29072 stop:29905 length:834 start_codon:yes stop_codon:yes gene_type:complete
MINYNGDLVAYEDITITPDNRAFKYGDSIFETIKVIDGKLIFWEDHYFRLMASMRMLRMKIPMNFTLEFLQQEILKIAHVDNKNRKRRARISITRKDGGFYLPKTNQIDYLIDIKEIEYSIKSTYRVDLFKDFYLSSSHLSTVKTNNKITNTLASIYAHENELDNSILLNERKGIVEVTNANLFLIKGTLIKTPALSEGCLKGIIREKVKSIIDSNNEYTLEETIISPFEILKADEIFITNSVIGIQPITHYRKKKFTRIISEKLSKSLRILEISSK